MELKDVLAELVTFVKDSSPEMWRILVRQVYVNIAQNTLGVVVSSIVAFVLYKFQKKANDSDWDSFDITLASTFAWIGFFIAIVMGIVFFASTISMLINPEFYAIRFLVGIN